LRRAAWSANVAHVTTPARLVPLLAQYDHAAERLLARLRGPALDSGDGERVEIPPLGDDEYLWEPVPGSWSVRPKRDGPAPGATLLVGAGEWGRDGGRPHPYPPPITTIAWRMQHVTAMLLERADWTIGGHSLTEDEYVIPATAPDALRLLDEGVAAWRATLVAADDEALDRIGHSQYPDGSDPEDLFLDIVWWVNQEVLHHGAEIALLRDLYRAQSGTG
jgi:hypothetical protein